MVNLKKDSKIDQEKSFLNQFSAQDNHKQQSNVSKNVQSFLEQFSTQENYKKSRKHSRNYQKSRRNRILSRTLFLNGIFYNAIGLYGFYYASLIISGVVVLNALSFIIMGFILVVFGPKFNPPSVSKMHFWDLRTEIATELYILIAPIGFYLFAFLLAIFPLLDLHSALETPIYWKYPPLSISAIGILYFFIPNYE